MWQVLELEEPLSRLSVIHVAGTKGKVRRFVRFDMHSVEGAVAWFNNVLFISYGSCLSRFLALFFWRCFADIQFQFIVGY